MTAIQCSG